MRSGSFSSVAAFRQKIRRKTWNTRWCTKRWWRLHAKVVCIHLIYWLYVTHLHKTSLNSHFLFFTNYGFGFWDVSINFGHFLLFYNRNGSWGGVWTGKPLLSTPTCCPLIIHHLRPKQHPIIISHPNTTLNLSPDLYWYKYIYTKLFYSSNYSRYLLFTHASIAALLADCFSPLRSRNDDQSLPLANLWAAKSMKC